MDIHKINFGCQFESLKMSILCSKPGFEAETFDPRGKAT
jgi:hypothetical protein